MQKSFWQKPKTLNNSAESNENHEFRRNVSTGKWVRKKRKRVGSGIRQTTSSFPFHMYIRSVISLWSSSSSFYGRFNSFSDYPIWFDSESWGGESVLATETQRKTRKVGRNLQRIWRWKGDPKSGTGRVTGEVTGEQGYATGQCLINRRERLRN